VPACLVSRSNPYLRLNQIALDPEHIWVANTALGEHARGRLKQVDRSGHVAT
jgi:hypothetical protein